MIRTALALAIAAALFFSLNFAWTHAALAGLSIGNNASCPQDLAIAARQRVATFFGEVRSAPWFVCLNEPRLGLDVSHGTARFAPMLPTIVVLGPRGQNVDVAAHEFAHAEIAARTSPLLRSYRLPTWFDEGLAMQLDHRNDYSAKSLMDHIASGRLKNTQLADLRWPSGFFEAGNQGKAHYALAKCVIASWLQNTDQTRLTALLEDVSWWRSFAVGPFAGHAAACLRR
ncbi:MAG: hypothetical protein K0U74_02785 [Alphaproteobacteria bacterium]|nr:hypothetical protein [Alphaproteobacteria bacterium]